MKNEVSYWKDRYPTSKPVAEKPRGGSVGLKSSSPPLPPGRASSTLAGTVNVLALEGTQQEKEALTLPFVMSGALAPALPLMTTQYAEDPPVQLIVTPLVRTTPFPLL